MANQGYTPDTRQRLQRASRFFARAEAFTLECPKCGRVYQIRRSGKTVGYWDPATARFRCRGKGGCQRSYVIGLVAWPVTPRGARTTPRDQVPNERQLAQLRAEGGGWWLSDEDRQRYPRVDESNLTTETERSGHDDDDDE